MDRLKVIFNCSTYPPTFNKDVTMSTSPFHDLAERLGKTRIVPVVSLPSAEAAVTLSEILLKHNLSIVEVTFRTAHAADGLAAIQKKFPQMALLAGTVLTPEQAERAVDSGATGIITPGFTSKLADHCRTLDVPFFPGVCTPSEVQNAMEAGCEVLKFFPAADMGGVKMLSLLKVLYSDVRFMPTGGINLDNVADYLALDNVLCCGGTWLCPEQLMADGKWDEVEERVATAMRAVQN